MHAEGQRAACCAPDADGLTGCLQRHIAALLHVTCCAQHRTPDTSRHSIAPRSPAVRQAASATTWTHVVWQLWLVGKLPDGSRVQHKQRTCQRHDGAQMLWLRAAWDSWRVAAPSAVDKPRRTHLRLAGRVSSKHTVPQTASKLQLRSGIHSTASTHGLASALQHTIRTCLQRAYTLPCSSSSLLKPGLHGCFSGSATHL